MEKNEKNKKNKPELTKAKDFLKSAPANISVVGIPGSNLTSFFRSLTQSEFLDLSEMDCWTIKFVENYTPYYHDTGIVNQDLVKSDLKVDLSRALSADILFFISAHLLPRDCANLLFVNKRLSQIFNNESIWKRFWVQCGGEHELSLPAADYKKLLFTERWTMKYTYLGQHKGKITPIPFNFNAIPAEIYRRNYQFYLEHDHEALLTIIVDVSKYYLEFELDGKKIKYFDMCKIFLSEINTRPHGPITKKQFKLVSRLKKGVVQTSDFHQMPLRFRIALIFVGKEELRERLRLPDHDLPPGYGNTVESVVQILQEEMSRTVPISRIYVGGTPVISTLVGFVKDAIMARALEDCGF